MSLFVQADFSGGLNTEFDPTKSPTNAFPLLINGRARRNVIEPTRKHLSLEAPEGLYQGFYGAGQYLILFIDGIAYYADVSLSPINFIPIATWTQMDPTANRIYAEIVPAQSNFFNRTGTVNDTQNNFNSSIAAFKEALFVFDGSLTNRPQAIFPDASVQVLGDFADWTKDRPIYVPYGLLPCFAANKLFLVSPDLKRVLQSVSGRAGDFMVNIINATGEAGGDADTVSATVSFNDITALRSLSSGHILASTLYGSWAIELDYNNPQFGEPYLNPIFLFPAGAINELSSISIASESETGAYADTAFITQSGIVAFNAVAQALRESNSFSLGAPIKGLLLNPETKKPFVQSGTCAIVYDDYGFFAINTLYGYGALVYDTTRRKWVSLDLSFGHVKQFVNLKIAGQERLFYITHENKVYEAFADSAVNTSRIYLGEWVPEQADMQLLLHMVDTVFLNIRSSGQLKITLFADGEKHDENVQDVAVPGYTDAPPIPIPFTNRLKSATPGWQFGNKALCWNAGVMLEWNFDGQLAEVGVDGKVLQAENVKLDVASLLVSESFTFIGNTGSEEINDGTNFADGFICVPVTKGHKYVYLANGNGRLVSGNIVIESKGMFIANQDSVAIEGPGIPTWSLRDITNLSTVLSAIDEKQILTVIGGGNHSYHFGTKIDVAANAYPFTNRTIHTLAGPVDIGADSGKYFYNDYGIPRYYSKAFQFVEFFFYNYDPLEPNGVDEGSVQASWLKNALSSSTKLFKIVVVSVPPYSTEEDISPGYSPMRLPFSIWGANAVISGSAPVMERRIVDGIPYFVCGTGGNELGQFAVLTEDIDAFRSVESFGYLEIKSDPLTCLFTFRDTSNNSLDEYAIYS